MNYAQARTAGQRRSGTGSNFPSLHQVPVSLQNELPDMVCAFQSSHSAVAGSVRPTLSRAPAHHAPAPGPRPFQRKKTATSTEKPVGGLSGTFDDKDCSAYGMGTVPPKSSASGKAS